MQPFFGKQCAAKNGFVFIDHEQIYYRAGGDFRIRMVFKEAAAAEKSQTGLSNCGNVFFLLLADDGIAFLRCKILQCNGWGALRGIRSGVAGDFVETNPA